MHISQFRPVVPCEQLLQVGNPSVSFAKQVLANWLDASGPPGHGQGLQSSGVPFLALPYQPSEHFWHWSPNRESEKLLEMQR